ncbi:apical junction component 1 homolog [Bufo gargarizans]|uniref:apical junction component 1 homolog n=1 Tax=Bufo gargarizans TaxID=30331 RepID=UPI001CF2B935|nr:apical junction component 1 homolog [Bufo gargarizans]
MTRTDPPDILLSSVYQDVKVTLNPDSPVPYSTAQCDSFMSSHREVTQPPFNKRHCRSFDFLESLDDQVTNPPVMENPQRGGHRRAGTPEPSSQPVGRRSSTRTEAQYTSQGMDTAREASKEQKRRPRSKSAPRAKTTFTSVPIQMSSSQSPPPTSRRGREVTRSSREPQKSVASPKREVTYAPTKVLMNEVHPIKLQPRRNSASRISPLCISNNCMEDPHSGKPISSPHVRCRVDIKPDDAVIQHAAHTSSKPCQAWGDTQHCTRQPGTPRSLAVPNARLMSVSRTPTPSDSYSVDPRMTHFACTPGGEMYAPDVRSIPYQSVASPRDFTQYTTRDCGQYMSPTMPTTFYYTDDDANLSQTIPIKSRGYYPRPYPDTGVPAHAYYTEDNPTLAPRTYYIEDPRSYAIQEAPLRTFYGEDPRYYPPRSVPTKNLYADDPRTYPIQSTSSKLYFTEDIAKYSEREALSRTYPYPRSTQPLQFSEWYFPDQSPLPYQTIQMPTFPTHTSGREAMLSSWHASYSMNQQRLGTDSRNYSRSWDNILNTGGRKEDPLSRGRSYENLLCRERRALSPDDRRQPVVVNLSCSPKRYAALSLSENSIIEKVQTDGGGGRYTMGRSWFVTPEITITDNDLRANGVGRSERRSASWDVIDSGVSPPAYPTHASYPAKDKLPSRSSRHRSLEQLDELIADLVIDYKPPSSRRPSEADALADQLRKLIKEDMIGIPRKSEQYGQMAHLLQNRPLKEQPTPTFPEYQRGQRRGPFPEVPVTSPHKPLEDCSPDLSADEDDLLTCSNAKCRRTETMFNACLYFKSCHSCYTYYCSRNCRREDWDIHKENCIYGRMGSVCRHVLKFCRENTEVHKAFSRIAKVGYLSRGRGVLFLGFPNPGSADNFLQLGLEGLLMSPTYLSLRELESYSDNLGEHAKELQIAGNQYDPEECFLLNVTVAVGQSSSDRLSSRGHHIPTIRKYAKIALASSSPERKITKKEKDMETLILTPPPGTADLDKDGEEGRKAREVCFIHIQRELRIRGVFLRHEYPKIYQQLCEFVENNKRFTPTTIYPIDRRTGKQFMCMIMAASEPRTLDWVASPNLLDDIM